MTKNKTKTFKAIEQLPNDQLKEAYKEMKLGTLKKDSIARKLQSKLYHENKEVIALTTVKYHIAMEMLERFFEE